MSQKYPTFITLVFYNVTLLNFCFQLCIQDIIKSRVSRIRKMGITPLKILPELYHRFRLKIQSANLCLIN